jgi:hypothetical protein
MSEGPPGSREPVARDFMRPERARCPDLLVFWGMGITNEGWLRVLMDGQMGSDAWNVALNAVPVLWKYAAQNFNCSLANDSAGRDAW